MADRIGIALLVIHSWVHRACRIRKDSHNFLEPQISPAPMRTLSLEFQNVLSACSMLVILLMYMFRGYHNSHNRSSLSSQGSFPFTPGF